MLLSVGIGLGSNLGDRSAELEAGLEFLRSFAGHEPVQVSPWLETAPVDCPPGSPPFLNAVAEFQLDPALWPPRALLDQLQVFELIRGRSSVRERNAPRPLDLDLLYYGDRIVREPDLIIPHPRATQRRFVLEPLSHLRPELILPGQSKTVRQLLAGLPVF